MKIYSNKKTNCYKTIFNDLKWISWNLFYLWIICKSKNKYKNKWSIKNFFNVKTFVFWKKKKEINIYFSCFFQKNQFLSIDDWLISHTVVLSNAIRSCFCLNDTLFNHQHNKLFSWEKYVMNLKKFSFFYL